MDSQNVLGIYISRQRATVFRARPKGQQLQIAAAFTVSAYEGDDTLQDLAQRVGQECRDRKLKYTEAAVALDCSLFMQHRVHSEFSNPKQISATVRFDTEEVIATDVSSMAVAFEIIKTTESGSELNVFTVDHKVLSEIILGLQCHGIDPLVITPDASALAHTLISPNEGDTESHPLMAVLARQHGYFLHESAGRIMPLRTFILGAHTRRQDLLQRETLTTIATLSAGGPKTLAVYDVTDSIETDALRERLGLGVQTATWKHQAELTQQASVDEDDPVTYAVAYGATLCSEGIGEGVNFRNDYMPHQGRRLQLQGAAKWASIAVTLLLIAVGLYLQLQTMHARKDRSDLRAKMAPDYKVAMRGRNLTDRANPKDDLERELRRMMSNSGGVTSDDASGYLERVLKAMNDCKAQKLDINIEKISINPKTVTVVGDSHKTDEALKFFTALEKAGLPEPLGSYGTGERVPFKVDSTIKNN